MESVDSGVAQLLESCFNMCGTPLVFGYPFTPEVVCQKNKIQAAGLLGWQRILFYGGVFILVLKEKK